MFTKEEQKCRNLAIKTHLINFPNEYHVMSFETTGVIYIYEKENAHRVKLFAAFIGHVTKDEDK